MKNYNFEKLEPKGVLSWFKKICKIPHGSFKEAALAEMIKHELNKAGCTVKQFSSGAIYATKAASKGYERKPMVLLQAHMDMVLTKRADVRMNMDKDPIKPFYDTTDGYIKCDGTTLGADDGIGVAAIMELMTSSKYQHGPLEVLLTVTEEADMGYCFDSIPKKQFKAKYLINLDNDVPEKMYTSSNGAFKITCEKEIKMLPVHKGTKTYVVELSRFDGGHSALVVHNPINNAICLLCEALYTFTQDHSKISLISLDGGNAMNAIPRLATAVIQMDPKDLPELKKHINHTIATAKTLAQGLDKDGKVTITLAPKQSKRAASYDETERILIYYTFVKTGTEQMDISMKHIFAAGNIGVVKTENDIIKTTMLSRCFFMDGLERQFALHVAFGKLLGFKNFIKFMTATPWLTKEPEKSKIIKLWSDNFTKVTGKYTIPSKDPGSIEPSAITANSPQLNNNSVSVGPRMYDCHSPLERIEVVSIVNFWKTLLLVLRNIK